MALLGSRSASPSAVPMGAFLCGTAKWGLFASSLVALGNQPDVGRQCNNRIRITVHRKLLGAEHWVGGDLEFARLWIE